MRAKWRNEPELLDRPTRSTLYPIATALAQEAEEQAAFTFDERRYLLINARAVCLAAVELGRDLTHDGLEDAADVAQCLRFAREE